MLGRLASVQGAVMAHSPRVRIKPTQASSTGKFLAAYADNLVYCAPFQLPWPGSGHRCCAARFSRHPPARWPGCCALVMVRAATKSWLAPRRTAAVEPGATYQTLGPVRSRCSEHDERALAAAAPGWRDEWQRGSVAVILPALAQPKGVARNYSFHGSLLLLLFSQHSSQACIPTSTLHRGTRQAHLLPQHPRAHTCQGCRLVWHSIATS